MSNSFEYWLLKNPAGEIERSEMLKAVFPSGPSIYKSVIDYDLFVELSKHTKALEVEVKLLRLELDKKSREVPLE